MSRAPFPGHIPSASVAWIAVVFATSLAAADDRPSIRGVGDLPGGEFRSNATGVSPDGLVVIGYGTNASGFQQAFRWTSADGMRPLPVLPGDTSSDARGVSAGGQVIVGTS